MSAATFNVEKLNVIANSFGWSFCWGTDILRQSRGGFVRKILFDSNSSAHVDIRNRIVFVAGGNELSQDTLEHYLLDFLMPRLLAFDGRLVLHGGILDCSIGAVGFIGKSGSGKSTLTASLQQSGFRLMSDDAIIISRNAAGLHGEVIYPSLRLFPASIQHVVPETSSTTAVATDTAKRRLVVPDGPTTSRLLALFVLDTSEVSKNIAVRRLEPAAACMAIIANSFALDPHDLEEAGQRFKLASEAAAIIPVYSLRYPHDYEVLPLVHQAILKVLDIHRPEVIAE